jgi:drug/metabolite transporter (DMT)-like permease
MSSPAKNKGLFNVHAAGLIFGGTSLFSKAIDLSALDMTAIRSVIAVSLLFIILRWRKQSLVLASNKHVLLMIITGALLGLHWITYFHAMQVSSIAIGMIALFTYPMITILLEPLLKGEKPQPADIFCGLLVIFGVFLMVPKFSLDSEVTLGILWGVFSALLFSVRNVIQRHYLSQYGGEVSIMYQGAVIVLMTLFFVNEMPPIENTYIWVQLLVLGAVFTALPHTLFAKGLRTLNAKTVSLVSCLQPVYGTIFAFIILKEQPALTTLVGGAIIVLAAAWETYRA